MGALTKEVNVVMLATEDKTNLLQVDGHKNLVYDDYFAINSLGTYQHLYFTSDEEIKEGDWCYDSLRGCIWQKSDKITCNGEIYKKIIATTDPKLETAISCPDGIEGCMVAHYQRHPNIPQSFVESYVKNPVDKVELEYDEWVDQDTELKLVNNEVVVSDGFIKLGSIYENERKRREQRASILKVDIILPDEQKLYTREEVETLCGRAVMECVNYSGREIDKWLKDNL